MEKRLFTVIILIEIIVILFLMVRFSRVDIKCDCPDCPDCPDTYLQWNPGCDRLTTWIPAYEDKCRQPADCVADKSLAGCSYDGCNYCCYDYCTVMWCDG